MKNLKELKEIVLEGMQLLEGKSEVKEAELFASSNELETMRLSYCSNIPSNALEEAKSLSNFGLSVRVLFKNGKNGFGQEASNLSKQGIENAFEKARKNSVLDTYFTGFPEKQGRKQGKSFADRQVFKISDEKAVDNAFSILSGALSKAKGKKMEFNLTGELDFLSERMAVANSKGINESEENTVIWSHLTTTIEGKQDVAGMQFDSSTHLKKINAESVGSESFQKALELQNAERIESGKFKVVLGRQAVTDILTNVFDYALSSIDLNASYFEGKLGKKVFDEKISITDNALQEFAIGSKNVSDEGIPTVKNKIIENGVLKNFLSNHYFAMKRKDLGSFNPSNGFRFGGGGRQFAAAPSIHATNLELKQGNFKEEELVREVREGLYVDRIWYTYPVNGSKVSDFTSTIRGNSFIIKNGELWKPLLPNTCRINDNLEKMLSKVIGVSKQKKPILVWGAENTVITPEIAVQELSIDRIARGLY